MAQALKLRLVASIVLCAGLRTLIAIMPAGLGVYIVSVLDIVSAAPVATIIPAGHGARVVLGPSTSSVS